MMLSARHSSRDSIAWIFVLVFICLPAGCDDSSNDDSDPGTDGDTDSDTDTDTDSDTDSDADTDTDSETDTDSDGDTDTIPDVDVCPDAVPNTVPGTIGGFGLDFNTFNHEGDDVRLCDFGGERPIVIQFSATWCSQCAFISGEILNEGSEIQELVDWIADGDIKYIEVLTEDGSYDPATVETLAAWHSTYPIENVSVLGDPDKELEGHIGGLSGYPSWAVLDKDYKWVQLQSTWDGNLLDALNEMMAAVNDSF